MRRKSWVRPELEKCEFFIDNPCENRDKWNGCFKKQQPVHIELGCGKGIFIAKLAYKNPDINYMGIDIKSEMLGLAKRNIEKEYGEKQIDNVILMSQEIAIIDRMMSEKDIVDRIYINFCNPWPKREHQKRRLTYTKQLEKYKVFLKNDGQIYFKTDDEGLFDDSLKYFEEAGFGIVKKTYDLHFEEGFWDNIVTEHEEMFSKEGVKIKAVIVKKHIESSDLRS